MVHAVVILSHAATMNSVRLEIERKRILVPGSALMQLGMQRYCKQNVATYFNINLLNIPVYTEQHKLAARNMFGAALYINRGGSRILGGAVNTTHLGHAP